MEEQELIDRGYKDGIKSFECLWQQILNNYEFSKVAEVMKFVGWGWYSNEYGGNVIPTLAAIYATTEKYMKRVYLEAVENKKNHEINTGGFTYGFIYETSEMYIQFTLTEYQTE